MVSPKGRLLLTLAVLHFILIAIKIQLWSKDTEGYFCTSVDYSSSPSACHLWHRGAAPVDVIV